MRRRLSLELAINTRELIETLRDKANLDTLQSVVHRAILVYDIVRTHCLEGGQVILRQANGREETLRILF